MMAKCRAKQKIMKAALMIMTEMSQTTVQHQLIYNFENKLSLSKHKKTSFLAFFFLTISSLQLQVNL